MLLFWNLITFVWKKFTSRRKVLIWQASLTQTSRWVSRHPGRAITFGYKLLKRKHWQVFSFRVSFNFKESKYLGVFPGWYDSLPPFGSLVIAHLHLLPSPTYVNINTSPMPESYHQFKILLGVNTSIVQQILYIPPEEAKDLRPENPCWKP